MRALALALLLGLSGCASTAAYDSCVVTRAAAFNALRSICWSALDARSDIVVEQCREDLTKLDAVIRESLDKL
jgi:hypothetical protein